MDSLEIKFAGIENVVDETEMEVADEPFEQTVESLNEALNRKLKEVKTLKRLKEAAQEREVAVGKQLSRKDAELEKMIAENNSLSTQLSQLIASKCEVQVKLVQLERKEIDLQSKEWRLDNEHAYLQENAKMLEARCDSTDRELLRLKHETSNTICDLEIMLRDSKSECERLELQVSAMKDSTVQYEQQVERLQEIIRQTRDSEIAVRETHEEEVEAKMHLARLFEEQYKDAHKLAEDYMGMIEALQSTVNEATERYGDLETEYAQDKANLQHELQRKEKMLLSLQEELKSTNEMLEKYSEEEMEENLSLMAPSSVSVRKLVQDNVSFTGLCGSLKAKEEELKLVSAERDELKQSLSAIISEFKERAPLIARDNEALNSTMMENERLLSDYDRMAQELHSEQAECQQAKKTIGMMKRDKERMQIHLDDLSRQTVVLLQEVEILKSQVPLHQRRRTSMAGRDDYSQMTPSMMVTERLLEFKDISELQVRNRELMATIRDLTSHIETEAANHQGVDIVKLAEKLDTALVDLKNMQEKEKKYELHIEQLTKQRNHFREMSQRGRSSHDVGVSPMKFKERAPLIARDNEALNSTMMENERLLSDYDRMAQELHSEQAECQQAKKTIGMMKRDKERMQIHLDDLSRQTVVLLQEVEILKSQVPLHQRRRTSMGRDDYSQMTPSMMVTERLLEFKDISELQVRNRELMATIRDLTSHIETEAANHQGVDIVKLAEKLDTALVDLKNMQEKEKKYELHIEQLTKQRNHFREMSQRGRSSHDVGVSPMKVATSPLKPVPSIQQVEEDRELKRQLAEAVEAVSRVTNKIDPVLKENKEMAKQTEEMKKEIDEKGTIILKLKAVVENRESKLQSSQFKTDEMKRHLDAMEAKNKTQTEYLARETKKSRDLQIELQSTQRKLNDSEATLRKLNNELSTLRAQIKSTVEVETRLNASQRHIQALTSYQNPCMDNFSQTEVFADIENAERDILPMAQCPLVFEDQMSSLVHPHLDTTAEQSLITTSAEEKSIYHQHLSEHQVLMDDKKVSYLDKLKMKKQIKSVSTWKARSEALNRLSTTLSRQMPTNREPDAFFNADFKLERLNFKDNIEYNAKRLNQYIEAEAKAASVTPVSRDGTPMALLQPMQATKCSSSSGTSGDLSGSSTPVVWQQQQQAPAATAARAVPRDESESSDEAPSGANVQLVRPQDLHTVPTSQVPAAAPAAQVPTTSTQAPILKRTRPVEVVPTEEPQPKVAKSEVLPPTEEVEVEEEPLQCTPEAEEVALDSEDDEPQVVIENEEELGSDDETEEAAEIEISEVPDKVNNLQDIGGTEESIAEERFLQDEEAPAEASGDQNAAQIVLDDPDMEGTILGS